MLSEPIVATNAFVALLTSLPTGNSTLRMRLWRALKEAGCGVLRDGVYVLPAGVPQKDSLVQMESVVRAAGGFAMTAELNFASAVQLEHVRKLFDRSEDYGALVARIVSARTGLRRLGERKAETLVQRLRRAFEELSRIDFYPGQAHLQAKDALEGLDRETRRLYSHGEPRAARGTARRLDPRKYRDRVWATRKNPWVDRLASAWLIKRFVDSGARFIWIERPGDCPKRAIGFDFDGALFTHEEGRVTYEVLLASFGLEGDARLVAIGSLVHFLDVGGIPVQDAKGLETLLTGIRQTARSDDEMAREAAHIFELLYAAYGHAEQQ